MHSRYRIVPAEPHHVSAVPNIERAAAVLLAHMLPESMLADTTPIATLHAAQRDGRLFIALDGDNPIGFALAELLAPGAPHLEEMDVLPAHTRQGVGSALLKTVIAWSRRAHSAPLTLTTFRDVPFNAPFYARHGFAEIADRSAWSPALRARVDAEHAHGLNRSLRVVMRYSATAP